MCAGCARQRAVSFDESRTAEDVRGVKSARADPPICMSGRLVRWPGEAGQIWSFCATAFRATFCPHPRARQARGRRAIIEARDHTRGEPRVADLQAGANAEAPRSAPAVLRTQRRTRCLGIFACLKRSEEHTAELQSRPY